MRTWEADGVMGARRTRVALILVTKIHQGRLCHLGLFAVLPLLGGRSAGLLGTSRTSGLVSAPGRPW
eukprot:279788-Prymnesium_polylepis.1